MSTDVVTGVSLLSASRPCCSMKIAVSAAANAGGAARAARMVNTRACAVRFMVVLQETDVPMRIMFRGTDKRPSVERQDARSSWMFYDPALIRMASRIRRANAARLAVDRLSASRALHPGLGRGF